MPDCRATARLAKYLARSLAAHEFPPLLLYGPLGCGKTFLTRELVSQMPGGAQAEVASPSFTVYNLYQTSPPLMHCDLYRCRGDVPEEIGEFMDERTGQLVVEWSEYLPVVPASHLDIFFDVVNDARCISISGAGEEAGLIIDGLLREEELRPFIN